VRGSRPAGPLRLMSSNVGSRNIGITEPLSQLAPLSQGRNFETTGPAWWASSIDRKVVRHAARAHNAPTADAVFCQDRVYAGLDDAFVLHLCEYLDCFS